MCFGDFLKNFTKQMVSSGIHLVEKDKFSLFCGQIAFHGAYIPHPLYVIVSGELNLGCYELNCRKYGVPDKSYAVFISFGCTWKQDDGLIWQVCFQISEACP